MSHCVTWLWEPHVDSFLRCNIWHVRGRDRDLIVDTGAGISSLRDALADLLDKPAIAAATHIHYDHVGGLHEFDTRLMHRIEAPRMNPYREFHPLRMSSFPASFRDYFSARDSERGDLLIDAIPKAGWNPDDYKIASTTPTRLLDEGDTIDLGDRAFEVMHLPGHSPGSIGLWEKAPGILFSGDAIYDGALLDNLPDSSVIDYVSTMKRLRALPVTIVHGGHEPSFGRERLIAIADAYLAARRG
ncbi:MAG TPA: MBL fold metallo-hydrolase [Candidatus Binataceae bacterium]|nr:MBL fold metallo-hydrolase [Candidatus Binataceae bacterium]